MNVNLAVPTLDNFKEVMNTAYIPVAPASIANLNNNILHANNTDNNDKQNSTFIKELQERTNRIENENNRSYKETETKSVEKTNSQTQTDRETGTNESKQSAETKIENRVQEKPNHERSGQSELATVQKTARESVSEKNQIAANNQSNIREIIQKHQLQSIEIAKAKENTKENFSDAQKINSNQNAEKVILKNLEQTQEKSINAKSNTDPTQNTDSQTAKTNADKNSESANVEKKDNTASLKTDTNTDKKTNNADTSVPNVTNPNARDTQSLTLTQAKLQELLPKTNIQEQYEAFKNQVTNSLENSIKFMIAEGENKVSIKLYPPELGKVQVELVIKDNQVNAHINTENIAVKEVILTNLDQLKSNIESAGILVNQFQVEVGGFRSQFDHQSFNGKPSGRRVENSEISGTQELSDNDWLADKIISQRSYSTFLGRSINYLV
jgi:flagellar hook-length control protein FliK